MTRDKAIDTWQFGAMRPIADALRKRMPEDEFDNLMDKMAVALIDGFIALGLLKLDEPKSAYRVALETIEREVREWNMVRSGSVKAEDVSGSMMLAFTRAGLKIVEKQ